MKKKLELVLLIDDDIDDIWMHKRAIRKAELTKEVAISTNGKEGLDFITNPQNTKPNIIFVDLNMPIMNGWEFIEEYQKLPQSLIKDIQLYILTSSIDVKEEYKSFTYKEVKGFFKKPLNKEILQQVTSLVLNT